MAKKKKKQKTKKKKVPIQQVESSQQKEFTSPNNNNVKKKLQNWGIPSFLITFILFFLYLFGANEGPKVEDLYQKIIKETTKIEKQLHPFFENEMFLSYIPNAMKTGETENYLKQYLTSLHNIVRNLPKNAGKYQENFPFTTENLQKWESVLDSNVNIFTSEFPDYKSLNPEKATLEKTEPLEIKSYAWVAYISIRKNINIIRKIDEKIKTIRR